jgi:type I restriction enzyme M protein
MDKIKNNDILVDNINQLLHNDGIEFNSRLEIIIQILNYIFHKDETLILNNINKKIMDLLINVSISKSEIYQKIFMFYGDKKTKINLNQYYTPITIGDFISSLCIINKEIIDPACGTGDLIINYNGNLTLWDISNDIIDICKLNCDLHKKTYIINNINSIKEFDKNNGLYDYCALNPPFGNSTLCIDKHILNNYELGKNKNKEEIGILFIERAINLLKDDGIVFIILPNGYLGNSTKNTKQLRQYLIKFRIIAILELPNNTFSRSGTGVSTSMLILQKKLMKDNYNIFISKINNIGYILNKKNTPFKYKTINGSLILDTDDKPIIDNDFNDCIKSLNQFIKDNDINNFNNITNDINDYKYEILKRNDINNDILDINRYLSKYTDIITNFKKNNYKKLQYYIETKIQSKFTIINDKEYLYLDIRQVNSPIYNKTNILFGQELPGRAKIKLNKYDIIVSKLKGKITFTIILDDDDNIISSNGFALLRPKSFEYGLIIFANLFSQEFKIQHNSLCTVSILESITDTDLYNIYLNPDIDVNKYKNIINALITINNEL